jgi:HPt (histidine-containing phosphotransfer) domain-containing protein
VKTEPDGAAVDEAVLRQLIDELGADAVVEISTVFAADAGRQSQAVLAALAAGDADTAARAGHRLKSASGFVGATTLSRLCAEIDDLARQHELEQARAGAVRLVAEAQRAAARIAVIARSASARR